MLLTMANKMYGIEIDEEELEQDTQTENQIEQEQINKF